MNLPIVLTLLRIALVPVVALLCYADFPFAPLVACALFTIAGATDVIDGRIARQHGLETPLGAFLDPVADKLMVTITLMVLIDVARSAWVAPLAIIIISREILVLALREWMARLGKIAEVAVAYQGKVKSGFQMTGIGMLIAAPSFGLWIPFFHELSLAVIGVAAILSVTSMTGYLRAALPHITGTGR